MAKTKKASAKPKRVHALKTKRRVIRKKADRMKESHEEKLIALIFAARQLQEEIVAAKSGIQQEKGFPLFVEPEPFLEQGSHSLIQRYTSAELLLRAVIAILQEGYRSARPTTHERIKSLYIFTKVKTALFSYGVRVIQDMYT